MPRAGLLSDDNRLRCFAERPLREIDIVADYGDFSSPVNDEEKTSTK